MKQTVFPPVLTVMTCLPTLAPANQAQDIYDDRVGIRR